MNKIHTFTAFCNNKSSKIISRIYMIQQTVLLKMNKNVHLQLYTDDKRRFTATKPHA